jgi:predicted ATPase
MPATDRADTAAPVPTAASPPTDEEPGRSPVPTSIRTPDQRLRVFVSSPLEELAAERAAVKEAIIQLRLTPVLFELGARPYPPRALYRAYLAQSDVFIGIYWQHYGWVGPGMTVSGLEDEYQLSGDKPRLIYLKRPAPQREARLQALLDRVQSDDTASYEHFASPDELRDLVANDLAQLVTERFTGAEPTPLPRNPAPLPVWRGLLVDREQEVAATRALLSREDVGLVTLTGPGGVGKTRVAVEVASDLEGRFADGVALIGLASLTDPDRLPAVVAQALRIPESGRPREEDLLAYLRPRQMLVVLDNVEQVIAAAPLATQVREAASRLKLLATSREPLRVRDEHLVPIPPLALPNPGSPPVIDELARIPSVALFVERAREIRPDFALTEENAAAVAEICRRLDGLPLALELAAARLAMLTPQALLARLGQRLPLLDRGPRDLPARQQTLRKTIAWSHDLLDDGEKVLFRRLGVFVGGFTLEAVEAVCLAPDPTLPTPPDLDALDGVSSLVDQSLVYPVRDDMDDPRFALLETIREYATEQLAATGEAEALRRRHAAYFVRLAEEAALPYPKLAKLDQEHFERVRREEANLEAALDWSLATDHQPSAADGAAAEKGNDPEALAERTELGLRLAGALAWYWVDRGQIQGRRTRLETLLARNEEDVHSEVRGLAEYAAGLLAWAQGDSAAAERWAEATIAAARAERNMVNLAFGHSLLGMIHLSQGDARAARASLQESVTEFQEAEDRQSEAWALYWMAQAALLDNDAAAAQHVAQDSLAIFQQSGQDVGRAWAQGVLGIAALAQGDSAAAVARFAEALPDLRAIGGIYPLAGFLMDAGTAWMEQGDLAQAQRLLAESLALWRDMRRPDGVAMALTGLGEVAAARGQPQRAARLLGAAEALLPASGPHRLPYLQALMDRAAATAREALGTQAFETAKADGAALSEEQAIAEALEEAARDSVSLSTTTA